MVTVTAAERARARVTASQVDESFTERRQTLKLVCNARNELVDPDRFRPDILRRAPYGSAGGAPSGSVPVVPPTWRGGG